MGPRGLALFIGILLLAGAPPALAQTALRYKPPTLAPPAPYKLVPIVPPKLVNDPAFDTLRKQLADVAKRKDRAGLAKLVVAQGFFWLRDVGESSDKRKSGIDNLVTALGLNSKDGAGWDILTTYADEPSASPPPNRKGVVCAPAEPTFDPKEFDALLKDTKTDVTEWGYPVSGAIEVHAAPQSGSPVIEKLGLAFVRVLPETSPSTLTYLRVITPSGASGYVSIDSIAPVGSEQLCYVKDGADWKISGYVGYGDPQ